MADVAGGRGLSGEYLHAKRAGLQSSAPGTETW